MKPWAIEQRMLDHWLDLFSQRLAGLAGNQEAFVNLFTGESEPLGYSLRGDVAVIRVDGALVKRLYAFDCGTSTEQIRAAVEGALENSAVRSILLDINSPGGTVDGTQSLAAFLRSVSQVKPIYAYTDGALCSAAYWIASACTAVAAQETATIGSIGVLCLHRDVSGQDAAQGVKRTYLHAGKDKALGNDAEPLSDRARASIQALLDATYFVFRADVAAFRDLDPKAEGEWADGKVFGARAALELGLIDEITTLDAFLERIQQEDGFMNQNNGAPQATGPTQAQVQLPQGQAAVDVEQALAAAVRGETERLTALAGAVFGQEVGEKFSRLAASGITPEQMAAASETLAKPEAKADAPQAKKDQMLAALQAAAPDPLSPVEGRLHVEGVGDLAQRIAGHSRKEA